MRWLPLLLALLVLPGTTGCDPCRGTDAAFASPALRAIPDDAAAQMEIQVSLPGLSVRMDEVFPGGRAGSVRWTGLSLERTGGLAAVVAILVSDGGRDAAGTIRVPVAPEVADKGAGLAVFLDPTGPAEVRIGDVSPEARAEIDRLAASMPPAWLAAPVLDVLGWFSGAEYLPLRAVSVSAGNGVLSLQLATGLEAAPLSAPEKARRPGMADDVTVSTSLSLLTALQAGGWLPVPPRGPAGATEKPPTWPTPPNGWAVRTSVPGTGDHGLVVPVTARRDDVCSFIRLDAAVKPGVAIGFLGWHPPQELTVTERRGGAKDLPDHAIDDLTRAALAGLAAPLSPSPVLGPGTVNGVRGPARLVRTEGDALIIDGLLVPAQSRPKRNKRPRGLDDESP